MEKLVRESELIEFKGSTVELKDGLIAIVAMLNKRRKGTLYFGVKNNGEIIGQDVGKRTITEISQAFKNHIDPIVIPHIDVLKSDTGKEYIQVYVEGSDRPYAAYGDIYIRSGEENKKIPMSELRRLFQSSSDLLKESSANNQELTFEGLCNTLKKEGFHVTDGPKLHRAYGLLNGKGTFNIQAELLSDQNAIPLSVVLFNGTDRTDISVRKQFSGPLLDQLKNVYDYVDSLNESKVDMSGPVRKEKKLIDPKAFDEAWINACVHNTWMLMMPPAVHIFIDRIEIISYGGIPYFQDDEGFFNGETMPVNESLMQVFLAAGITEHTGHGIPIITETYGREAFVFDNSMVKVILHFPFSRGGGVLPYAMSSFTEKESSIIAVIMQNPHCTIDQIASTTELGRSNVARIIKNLKSRGIIVRKGSKKSGEWSIVDTGSSNIS